MRFKINFEYSNAQLGAWGSQSSDAQSSPIPVSQRRLIEEVLVLISCHMFLCFGIYFAQYDSQFW